MSSRRKVRARSRSSKRCKAVSRKRVCGPRHSCRYPKAYSRAELLRKARKDDDLLDDFGSEGIDRLSTPQLCSHLGLVTREAVQFNRVIEGRKCGPEREPNNPNVWTKAELVRYAAKHHIMPAQQAGKLHREELCVKVADWAYPHRRAAATFKIPDVPLDLYPAIEYRGNTSYVLPFIYALLKRYPDCCFYMNPDSESGRPHEGVAFDCGTEEVIVRPHLTEQMRACKKRFFFTLVALKDIPKGEHVGKHANMLLYDRKLNQVWHWEPLRAGRYHECDTDVLFKELEPLFKREVNPRLAFVDAPSYCPKLNVSRLIYKHKHKGFNPEGVATGLCVIMNLWMIDNKLAHPNLNLKQVNEAVIRALREHEYGMLNHILNWMKQFLELREMLMADADEDFVSYMRELIAAEQKDRFKSGIKQRPASSRKRRK